MHHQCGQRLLIRIRRGSVFPTCRKSLAIPAARRNGGPPRIRRRRSWIAIAGAAFDRRGRSIPRLCAVMEREKPGGVSSTSGSGPGKYTVPIYSESRVDAQRREWCDVRARFTTDEIRECALGIVERDGVAGLSVRAVASRLGTGPMTLYNYVNGRDGLEELVVDAIVGSVALPEPTDDWRTDFAAAAVALWETLRSHPNAIPLILTRRSVSASSFAPAERMIEALSRSRLDEYQILAAFRAVLALVTGSAQAEFAGLFAGTDYHDDANIVGAARIGEVAGTDYPRIAALATVSQRSSAAEDFHRGLGIFLTGLIATEARQGAQS
jgi:AcrR family transcriptional regulator